MNGAGCSGLGKDSLNSGASSRKLTRLFRVGLPKLPGPPPAPWMRWAITHRAPVSELSRSVDKAFNLSMRPFKMLVRSQPTLSVAGTYCAHQLGQQSSHHNIPGHEPRRH